MRRSCVLLVAVGLLMAQPVLGADSPRKTSAFFGKYNCKPAFPCSDTTNSDKAREVAQKLSSIGEQCASRGLGMTSNGSMFEESLGLDSSLCLTSKAIETKDGMTMTPKCCVVPVDETGRVCQLVCTKIGVK